MTDATALGLRLDGVTVGYRDRGRRRDVVSEIDVTARPGELTALIGPNGTGKSTLLRTIAGLQKSLDGAIRLDGRSVGRLSASERARFQSIVLTERVAPGRLTGRELVGLGRHPHTGFSGRLTAADHRIVDEAIASVGASALADRDIGELSDGERQRIMTARALAQQPRLLLMDEPSAFLDAPGRVALAGLVRRIATDQEVVVVISTHEVELMLQVADRIWLLDRSGRLHDGTPEELVQAGLLGAVFDSEDLEFDPRTGTFRLVSEDAGTVRVAGPDQDGLDHLLVRRGWVQSARGPVDLEIRPAGGADWQLFRGGRSEQVTGFAALAEALRVRPQADDLQRVGPEEVRTGLEEAARIGPYFAVDTVAAGVLLRELSVTQMRAWSESTGERVGTDEFRVGAATWQFGLLARIWSTLVGSWATSGVLPDLEDAAMTDADNRLRLTLVPAGGWLDRGNVPPERLAAAMVDLIVAITEPLHDQLVNDLRIARGLVDGNRAAAAVGAIRALRFRGSPRDPEPLFTALVRHPTLAPHQEVEFDSDGRVSTHVRRSCCLFYRTERGGTCGDCPVNPTAAAREARPP